ncbi:hypothetical protein [Peribacillus frigoritolerans]|uniref:hypothetical protein n=1 Tax=Peribacillus frigoritolerans TaxID=450367 RepID=UPI0024C13F76|nr:hypothetical protein [Peribacillus frigoritolerans]WHX62780.1 hypothetical protein QNH33_04100 [Peribacillus frigoritolerans]
MEKKTIIGLTFTKEGEKNVNGEVLEENVEAVKEYATSFGYELRSQVTINVPVKHYEQTKAKDYKSFFPTQNKNLQNIGEEFKLSLYSQRWGHNDFYTLTKTEEGWNVTTNKLKNAKGDKHAGPHIENALTGESISFPSDIGYFLSDIWDASQTKSKEEVQSYFYELSEWISTTEKTKPNFGALLI